MRSCKRTLTQYEEEEVRTATETGRRPWENTGGRWPSIRQGERTQKRSTLPTP